MSDIPKRDLSHLTAIITGAASGFGREIAHAFANSGANVCVQDLNETGAQKVAEEIKAKGVKAVVVAGDVSKAETWTEIVKAASQIGDITTLVNNAGITYPNKV